MVGGSKALTQSKSIGTSISGPQGSPKLDVSISSVLKCMAISLDAGSVKREAEENANAGSAAD